MMPFSPTVSRIAALTAAIALLCFGATSAASSLPYQVAGDVTESFQLLTSTYYDTVDPQTLLAAASDALVEAAHKRGVTIATPALHVEGDRDATLAELDGAIASTAHSAHAPASDFAYVAIEAMAKATNDRYTQFFTPDEFKAFNEALDPQRIGGIGVMIEPTRHPVAFASRTCSPTTTPAERAGLQTGDVITAVDGTSTKGMTVDVVSGHLRGKAGTNVAVTVQRPAAPATMTITRADVQPPTVVFKLLPNGIGYVWVMEFGRSTPNEFDTAISRLMELGAKAVVLDLRNDGGGYVNSALDISSRFIANKALLTVKERGKRPETIDSGADPSINLPVTVLVNQYTASASEITAGALQDDGIGMLVGARPSARA